MTRMLILLFILIPSIALAEDDCPRGMETYCRYQEAKEADRREQVESMREQEEVQRWNDMLEIARERNNILREEQVRERRRDLQNTPTFLNK